MNGRVLRTRRGPYTGKAYWSIFNHLVYDLGWPEDRAKKAIKRYNDKVLGRRS